MSGRILLVDDEIAFCELASDWLSDDGYQVQSAHSLAGAQQCLADFDADLILLDLALPPQMDPNHTLAALPSLGDRPVIILTGHAERQLALTAMAAGAWDFLAKPVDPDMLAVVIRRALTKQNLTRELSRLKDSASSGPLDALVGSGPAMNTLKALIHRIAPTDVPVLVTGPSGTGKEVVSRALHQLSRRAQGPFVSVHCGAIPAELLESELFGYKKGAFTGADRDRPGLLAMADGGTLFLDEIGDMPLSMQVKLLRVLQEGTFYPVGGREQQRIDVRVLSATNADLPSRVAEGRFREDLYYRIKGVNLQTPALADRPEDLPLLCEALLGAWCRRQGRPLRLSAAARQWFLGKPWPGNVRELKNTLESVAAIAQGQQIELDDIALLYPTQAQAAATGDSLDEQVRALEIRLISQALSAQGGNRSAAARQLGLSRQGLLKKLERYGLDA
ncbi:sigma-54-dependent transcriptional regulator [Gallaecimonas xiamenensis]|uniref:Two component sigma-54-specific Fis family transcriptional regulator n=1 Tax=Gallaecimonas xiamenensis 3-C-1 TaxID=745411 RepID=K2J2D2_9GAMM|nr:sigma-54 dependent transcriptional regulator [Gallaecimonas xiamenensis]EKE77126.1 two component sigma-54-specific Fis family transcriptional regulator [Gallaecimonas xiamenensis 3-C-1]